MKIQKKFFLGGGGSGGGGVGSGGVRWGGGLVGGGVRVDVNAMLGVGGGVYNIKKMKKCVGGRGRGDI